jgi:RNase H-fold protein (predicted Holliday junction resolvase)
LYPPLQHPGQQSQADEVKAWVESLAKQVSLPLVLWDEQLSSADARELARSKRRKPSDPIDDPAARDFAVLSRRLRMLAQPPEG